MKEYVGNELWRSIGWSYIQENFFIFSTVGRNSEDVNSSKGMVGKPGCKHLTYIFNIKLYRKLIIDFTTLYEYFIIRFIVIMLKFMLPVDIREIIIIIIIIYLFIHLFYLFLYLSIYFLLVYFV